jgi:type I restriction enzyme R subunit
VTLGDLDAQAIPDELLIAGRGIGAALLNRLVDGTSGASSATFENGNINITLTFFGTVQLVMAGNDTEGLRYGTTETSEKYYTEWKEPGLAEENRLDRAILQLCAKERLLEIAHDFIVFDCGIKKACRHNQYFGVKAAQAFVKRRDGGIIWHTQGSGKSLDAAGHQH